MPFFLLHFIVLCRYALVIILILVLSLVIATVFYDNDETPFPQNLLQNRSSRLRE